MIGRPAGNRFAPLSNRWVAGIATAEIADKSDCEGFLAASEDIERRWKAAGGSEPPADLASLIPGAADGRLLDAAVQANNDFFRYDLTDLVAAGEPEIQVHEVASTGSRLPSRLTPEASTRKLTFLLLARLREPTAEIQLRDHEGRKAVGLRVGVLAIFPAFLAVDLVASDPTTATVVLFSAYGPALR